MSVLLLVCALAFLFDGGGTSTSAVVRAQLYLSHLHMKSLKVMYKTQYTSRVALRFRFLRHTFSKHSQNQTGYVGTLYERGQHNHSTCSCFVFAFLHSSG